MLNREYVILVDENDSEIGVEEKLTAHQQAKLHRAFSIFIVRYKEKRWQMLLQQRQHTKYHSAGLWANTCCSHPMPKETITHAAQRRLKEEIGISAELKKIGCFYYKADVGSGLVEHVFIGTFNDDTIPFNTEEVVAVRWVDAIHLQSEVKQHPEQFVAWFSQAYDLALSKLISHNESCED
jgi:isopentenyl-diphosphate delta-isomerase